MTETKVKIIKQPEALQHLVGRDATLLRTLADGSGQVQFVVGHPDRAESTLTLRSDEVDAETVGLPFVISRELMNDFIQTAAEGGINHWAGVREYRWVDREVVSLRIVELDDNEMVPSPENAKKLELFDGEITHAMIAKSIRQILHGATKISAESLESIRLAVVEDDASYIDAGIADSVVQIAALGGIVYG